MSTTNDIEFLESEAEDFRKTFADVREEIGKVIVGQERVRAGQPFMVAEDFAYYQQEVSGVFFFYGINPPGVAAEDAAPNHSPRFFVHEPAMETGLRAMLAAALDRLSGA